MALALCAAEPPTGETTVVGGVLIDLHGSYWMYNEPLGANAPIRVAVEYLDDNGKTSMYAFRIQTDGKGYFKIKNAPAGKYILKAIEMHIGQSTHVTAACKYGQWAKGEQYRYWGVLPGQMYRNERYLIETIFETEIENGIVDLGITHLTINANERLGGSPFKNYSPNSQPPWIRMSLIQGAGRFKTDPAFAMIKCHCNVFMTELGIEERINYGRLGGKTIVLPFLF